MGFKVLVNDEQVWESEGDPILVDKVSVVNGRGEVASVGSHGQDTWIGLNVNIRSADAEYLDLADWRKSQEVPVVEPVEPPTPATTEEQAVEAEAVGDLEF